VQHIVEQVKIQDQSSVGSGIPANNSGGFQDFTITIYDSIGWPFLSQPGVGASGPHCTSYPRKLKSGDHAD
jgi:hypothetical protein